MTRWRGLLLVAVITSYLGWAFQAGSATFWRNGIGDWIDPYFINAILEHWYRSVQTFGNAASPPMYFPAHGTLGYSVGLILYAPIYIVLRWFLHPFQAHSMTLLVVMETGLLSMYLIFRRWCRLGWLEALLLTMFFATSGNEVRPPTGTWSQFISIFLVPSILWLGGTAGRMPRGRRRLALAAIAALLAALLPAQEIYTGLFTLFFSAVMLAGWAVLAGRARVVHLVRAAWSRDRPLIAAVAGGVVTGAAIFAWIYLASYQEHHAFPRDQLWDALARVEPSRWTGLRDAVHAMLVFDDARVVILAMLAAALAWLPRSGAHGRLRLGLLGLAGLTVFVLFLPLRFGRNSLWRSIFTPLPGYEVIRDPSRIVYAYELTGTLAIGWCLSRLPSRSILRRAVIGVALVMLIVNWNARTFVFARPNAAFDRWVAAPIDVNASCRSFYVTGASAEYMSRSGHMWSLYGMDALFIALKYSLPTVNGYSAWAPRDWNLANPQGPGYDEGVRRWIDAHGLRQVCELDIDRRVIAPPGAVRMQK